MTDQEFQAAQAKGEVEQVQVVEGQLPPDTNVEQRQINTYIEQLETLRKGFTGCKMYLGSVQAPGTGTPYATLNLDSVSYNESLVTDATSHVIKIAQGGFYLINAQAHFDSSTAGDSIALDVKSGSTPIGYAAKNAAGNTDYISLTLVAKFNGNESVSMGAYTSQSVLNGSTHTFLSVTKL